MPLRRDVLSTATVRGYRYCTDQLRRWFSQVKGLLTVEAVDPRPDQLPQHLVNVEALKAASVHSRLKALRRVLRLGMAEPVA
jgi:hypothetical protein